MKEVISVSVGEIVLKGKNRRYFEDVLIGKMRRALEGLSVNKIYKELGKIYVDLPENNIDEAVKRLKNVFGLVYVSRNIRVDKSIEEIEKAIHELVERSIGEEDFTFKIIASRADKKFPMKSPEMNPYFGGYVLKNFENASVDVHNPDLPIYVEVRDYAYVYSQREKALGGMPMGTNGKGLVLLSGGIDSPVAAFMMARRGITIDAVHFHSYPYTSERAEQKVIELGEIVSRYTGPMKIHSINLLEIQKAIALNCEERNMTILSRRFMIRIAEIISEEMGIDALITGDNLGQVASQTIKSLKIIDKTTDMLVFRPLISMDKQDIVEIAKDIGSYDVSIQPFDDCCTVFAPKHPNLKPKLDDILKEEEKLDIEKLLETVMSTRKIIEID